MDMLNLVNAFRRIQKGLFDTLQVRLYNCNRRRKHHYTTPVWSWLGYSKPISASFCPSSLIDMAKIILLNGASSSGKTSIAKALQKILSPTYVYLALDTFIDMFPEDYADYAEVENEMLVVERRNEILSVMLTTIHSLSASGNNLIIDHVLDDPTYMSIIVKKLHAFKVAFISVDCSLAKLEKREAERGDRKIGLAKSQYKSVHEDRIYDFKVDTSQSTSEECALKIIEYLQSPKTILSAFFKMNKLLE